MDNTFSRSTAALMLWLAAITALLVVLAGVILAIADVSINGEQGFIEGAWAALLRTLDPGTMGDDIGWPFRVIALIVTLGGVFIVSTLIGLIATAMSQKLEELRKGRTPVIESGHTLILGWSPKLIAVISELMIANQNEDYSAIVVMSEADKVWMEDEIRERVAHNGSTRVVCRTGHVWDPQDLELVDPMRSKAVIVLSPETEGADADVIRTVLALMQHDPGLARLDVIAELFDDKNAEALGMATEGRVMTVVSSDVIARVTAQVCRQSGLSGVYEDLLDFAGHEIYFSHVPDVAGLPFGDAVLAFDSSTVIGVRFGDGRIELNPPMQSVLSAADSVIAIAEDDDAIVFTGTGDATVGPVEAAFPPFEPVEEHRLIVGWNYLGPRLLQQLNDYVADGSTAHVVYDPAYVSDIAVKPGNLERLRVSLSTGDTSQDGPLRDAFRDRSVDRVVVLCYREGLTIAESDARTLMTLLQLRRIIRDEESTTGADISIVTELLDVKDVALARVANPDDFVVSEQLASLVITQLSENPELGPVFADLFDSYESELMLRPAHLYVSAEGPVPFREVVVAARHYHEIAIGYRKRGRGAEDSEIVINPDKRSEVSLTDGDHLIVLTPG